AVAPGQLFLPVEGVALWIEGDVDLVAHHAVGQRRLLAGARAAPGGGRARRRHGGGAWRGKGDGVLVRALGPPARRCGRRPGGAGVAAEPGAAAAGGAGVGAGMGTTAAGPSAAAAAGSAGWRPVAQVIAETMQTAATDTVATIRFLVGVTDAPPSNILMS